MLLEQRIETPVRITGQSYDPNRKYIVGEIVRATVSGESRGWILLVDAPAGTPPRANSAYWGIWTNTLTTNRGAQGLPAPPRMVRYVESDGTTTRPNYVDGDTFEEISDDGGTTWVRRRIKGDDGQQGIAGVGMDGRDGNDAPLLMWQFAPEPEPNQEPTYRPFGSVWLSTDKYVRFYNGMDYSGNLPIMGEDGRDGLDIHVQFSDHTPDSGNLEEIPDSQISTIDNGQAHARWRLGTLPWGRWFTRIGTGVGQRGPAGMNAPYVQIEYSADGNAPWVVAFEAGTHKYIRFSRDGGNVWTQGYKFIGDDAPQVQIQYAATNSADDNDWDSTFVEGTDKFIRISVDGGTNWTPGYRFIGDDGNHGNHGNDGAGVYVFFSDNGQANSWTSTTGDDTEYIRFETSPTVPVDAGGIKFVGTDGLTGGVGPIGPMGLPGRDGVGRDGDDGQSIYVFFSDTGLANSWAAAPGENTKYVRFETSATVPTNAGGTKFVGDDGEDGTGTAVDLSDYVRTAALNRLSDRVDADEAQIRSLREKTLDIDVRTDVTWSNTTEAEIAIFPLTASIHLLPTLAGGTYASAHTITTAEVNGVFLVMRIPTGADKKAYRVENTHPTSVGHKSRQYNNYDGESFQLYFENSGGYDYYVEPGTPNFTERAVLQVQKSTEDHFSTFNGKVLQNRVRDSLGNLLPRIYSVDTDPASIDERQLDRNYRFIVYLPANAIPSATKVRIVFNGIEGGYQTHNQTATQVNLTMGLNDTQFDALKRVVIIQQFIHYEIQFANAADEIVWRHPGNIAIDPSFLPVEISDDEIAQDLSDADLTDVVRSFTGHKVWDIVQKGINAVASRLLSVLGNNSPGRMMTTLNDGSWVARAPQSVQDARNGTIQLVSPWSNQLVRENVIGAHTREYSLNPTITNLHARYTILPYDVTRWNANNLPLHHVMFNNTDLTAATQLKMNYSLIGRDKALMDGLRVNHIIEFYDFENIDGYEDIKTTWKGSISAISTPAGTIDFKLITINTVGATRGVLDTRSTQRIGVACTNPQVNNEVTREVASAATLVKQGSDITLKVENENTWYATGFTVTAGKLMYLEIFDPRQNRQEADTQNSLIPTSFIITDSLIALPKRAASDAWNPRQAHCDFIPNNVQAITTTSNELLLRFQNDSTDGYPIKVYYYE